VGSASDDRTCLDKSDSLELAQKHLKIKPLELLPLSFGYQLVLVFQWLQAVKTGNQ
jgi:hypothetical protein